MKYITTLSVCAVLLTGCINNTEEIEIPSEGVSYAADVEPILRSNCGGCHGGSGGFSLGSYDALLRGGNNYGPNTIIVPENADASGLVIKIDPALEVDRILGLMPLGGSLSSAEIQVIRTWINEGALNN